MLSGLAAAVLIGVSLFLGQGVGADLIVERHGYFLGGFLLVGGICGEIQQQFRKKEIQLNTLQQHTAERLRRLDTDLYLVRAAKAELERLLATHDSEVSTLDSDLRRLMDSEGDDFYEGLLLLLNRQARVSDAAVYLVEDDGSLRRHAILGSEEHLPQRLDKGANELVAMAIKHHQTVTIPDFWDSQKELNSHWLVAAPLMDSRERLKGIILITGMPFIAINQKSVRLLTLICRWVGRGMEIREAGDDSFRWVEKQKIYSVSFFKEHLELAHRSYQEHHLASSIVMFFLPRRGKEDQGLLERAIAGQLREGDFATALEMTRPNLAVLLPLTGERGAGLFRDRVLLRCRNDAMIASEMESKITVFDSDQTAAGIWKELHETGA